MPRHPRVHAEGLLYHVIPVAIMAEDFFRRKRLSDLHRGAPDRAPALPLLALSPCLDAQSLHLLLEVHRFPTARILQSLLTGYARRFNKIHHQRGHLFEGRYKAIVCDRDNYLLELVRYIHLNRVRASLVKQPGKWPWSGHRISGKRKTRSDRLGASHGATEDGCRL